MPETIFNFKNLLLADKWPYSTESSKIDFLIGNDYYMDIITGKRMKLYDGLYLLSSRLGWILTGRTKNDKRTATNEYSMFVMERTNSPKFESEDNYDFNSYENGAKPNLEHLWNLDSIGIKDCTDKTEDDKAQALFNETVKYENERYYVSWPWRDQVKDLPVNFQLSLGRLKSTVRKLQQSPDLIKKYDDIIRDQIAKGVIEQVTSEKENHTTTKHYIPHFAVLTPLKTTTKVRIVYDASAIARKGEKSLNDCLYRGPVFMENLCGLLLRFRLPAIILLSDIEKAFLQVGLQEQERDVTRFLWLKDYMARPEANNIDTFRFCRVPFGMVSSPFLLGATIDHHLEQANTKLANDIRSNIYMDNVILGTNSIQEAKMIYKEAKETFNGAGMNLREWVSNSKEFIDELPPTDKGVIGTTKVLGLQYDTISDEISIAFKQADVVSSKRGVLKQIAQVFDPLGLFSPLTIKSRIYLQELWKIKLEWDDPLPNKELNHWLKIAADLSKIPKIHLPRWISLFDDSEKCTYELYCFCDASLQSYCAASYLKITKGNSMRINLVFAKARVAPTKKLLSIPKLELMAVLIGVRSLNFVQKHLHKPITTKILWSDSQCVLYWIESQKITQLFIKNRITEIKQSKDIQFRYVKTSENPADLATRGDVNTDIPSLWWFGPKWLTQQTEDWPKWTPATKSETILPECGNLTIEKQTPGYPKIPISPFGIKIERFSSLTKLLRITAWCQRFINKIQKNIEGENKSCDTLLSSEIEVAKEKWIKFVQEGNNDISKNLKTFTDEKGLIRGYSRLEHADLTEDAKYPVILPRNHELTKLIIENYHKKLGYASVSLTLSQIRHRYHISKGRATVKRYINKCQKCKFWEVGPYKSPNFPPFPSGRVKATNPFTYVGLDYFGPLYAKGHGKCWVCLFTCLTVRAIHLEIVNDMTSAQFLLALRRFIARRGKPNQIISDNATQFRLVKSVIDSQWNKVIKGDDCQEFSANEEIEWSFIIQLAPWQGGFYERMIGIVKRSLRKSLGKLSLRMEQLSTLLIEIEAVINSRPITFIESNAGAGMTLTPGNFLSLNPKLGLIDPTADIEILKDADFQEKISTKALVVDLWKKSQAHLKTFWQTWQNEYLISLRERHDWKLKEKRILSNNGTKVGDIVIVKEPSQPRLTWKMGQVTALIQGKDKEIRGASIRLSSNKEINRHLTYLFPIEIGLSE